MATSGLSRRRVGNASSSNSTTTSDATPPSSAGLHAGSAFERGSKIAYDPRDLVGASEQAPKLTIMEEVLLLGIKDKQGYLSFWNDNISYALRGCILMELALRRRIALERDPARKRYPLPDRIVEVIDDKMTGETLLDETLRLMKSTQDGSDGVPGEKLSVNTWIDLLSGETWNVLKISFQLKQVRERLAKGLVDKGVLRTEKRNFLLFDMATHPVADVRVKESIVSRVVTLLTAETSVVPEKALVPEEGVKGRVIRSVGLVCAAYTASVLDNAFGRLGYEEREAAFQRADDILAQFSTWPFEDPVSSSRKRRQSNRIATGSSGVDVGRESVLGLVREVGKEMQEGEDVGFELIAGVFEVLSKLDSLV